MRWKQRLRLRRKGQLRRGTADGIKSLAKCSNRGQMVFCSTGVHSTTRHGRGRRQGMRRRKNRQVVNFDMVDDVSKTSWSHFDSFIYCRPYIFISGFQLQNEVLHPDWVRLFNRRIQSSHPLTKESIGQKNEHLEHRKSNNFCRKTYFFEVIIGRIVVISDRSAKSSARRMCFFSDKVAGVSQPAH